MPHLPLAALLLALATPALADDVWQQIDTDPGAYWIAAPGAQRLELHCNGQALMMVLFGGAQEMPKEVQTETDLSLIVTLLPSDLARRVTGSWLGPFDNALNGDFPSDPAFLSAFEDAEGMTITGPAGGVLFTTGMSGATWARFGFGEVCGV